jgi:hypothetical protein
MPDLVHSSFFLELEIEVSGLYYAPFEGNWDEPPEGARGEYQEVTGVIALGDDDKGRLKRVDLLAGVDKSSPAYAQIIKNITNAFADDLDNVLALAEID